MHSKNSDLQIPDLCVTDVYHAC